jgi:prepilin-type N-terminal cleavage/methylation domain-containing protein
MRARRSGFTLTELLIVIGILLLLSTLSLAVYNTGRSSDRIRSAARVGQSAFLGAKDRAMHAKDQRGIRLTRDAQGPQFSNGIPALVNGFVFTQPIAHDSYGNGSIQLERISTINPGVADVQDITIVRGITPALNTALGTKYAVVDWDRVSGFFASPGQIRIPATTGQWYNFTINTSGPYALGSGNECLILSSPFNDNGSANPFNAIIAHPFVAGEAGAGASTPVAGCDIQFGNEVLPFHQPIAMPAGVVIDLRYSSANMQFLAGSSLPNGSTAPYIDITFSPRGSIYGAAGGLGAFYLCLRDLEDATGTSTNPLTLGGLRDPSDPACKGECLILAVNPTTGLVQTYPANLTDIYTNSTGAAGADGYADNLFSFAQQGKAAGR